MLEENMKLLSASELSVSHRRGQEQMLPSRGLKQFMPSYSWLETKQIQSAQEDRKSLLQAERIEKWSMRSCATWLPDKNMAEVTRKIGKHWNSMGFEKGGSLLLHPEEALYMLETNVLELQYGDVALSVQQAYALLLGPLCLLAEYRTYCKLQRSGLNVVRHTGAPLQREQQPGTHMGNKRLRDPDKETTSSKRRVSNDTPAKNIIKTKIELIDLEDDESIKINELEFVPDLLNKEYICIKVAPDYLLPENIKTRCAEYVISKNKLKEPGNGSRPAPRLSHYSNWNQPNRGGQPSQNNNLTPSYHQNMNNQQLQRFPVPFMHQRFMQQNNMFVRNMSMQQQFMRPVMNLNCYMSYNFPFLPASLHQSYSAQFYSRGPNSFMNMGRPMMQQTSHPMSFPRPMQRDFQPQRQNESTQQRVTANNDSWQDNSLTPPPNPGVPKLKAKSWVEVKAKLATSIVTITLDQEEDSDENLSRNNGDNDAFVQPEDCKSMDSILTKLRIFKSFQSTGEKSCVNIKFDAFHGGTTFRKSELATPAYHVVVVSNPDALLSESDMTVTDDGVPILYAIVQPDTINFFTLTSVNLPTLTS